jgi:predicted RNase H-like nuclease
MASASTSGKAYEDDSGLTAYEKGYVEGRQATQKHMKGQIDFFLREREEFLERIRELEAEIQHLRRTTGEG